MLSSTTDPYKKYSYMRKTLWGEISKTKITQHSKMGFKPFTVHLKIFFNIIATKNKFLTPDEKDIFDKNDVIKSFFEIYENLCPLGYTLDLKPYHNL